MPCFRDGDDATQWPQLGETCYRNTTASSYYCGCTDNQRYLSHCNADKNVCECFMFWGFEEENGLCAKATTLSRSFCAVSGVSGVIEFILFLWAVKTTITVVSSWKTLKAWNARTSTLVFLCCCTFFHVLWHFGELLVYCQIATVTSWERGFRYVSNIGLGFFFVFASLNVSVMWLQVARRTKHMKKGGTNVRKYRHRILFFGLTQGTVLIVCTALGLSQIASIFTVFTLLMLAIIYCYGAYQLKNASRMSKSSKGGKGHSAIVKVIKTSYAFSAFAGFYIICAVLYTLGNSSNNGLLMSTAIEGLLASVAAIEILLMLYVRSTSKKTTKEKGSTYVPDSQFASRSAGGTQNSSKFNSIFTESSSSSAKRPESSRQVALSVDHTPPLAVKEINLTQMDSYNSANKKGGKPVAEF